MHWGCVQLLLRNTPWWLLVLVVAACLDWEQSDWDWRLQVLALGWGLHGGNGCLWGGSEVPLPGLAEEAVCGAALSRFPPSQFLVAGLALLGTPSSMQGAMG